MGAKKKYKAHNSKYVRHISKYLRHIFYPPETRLENADKITKNANALPATTFDIRYFQNVMYDKSNIAYQTNRISPAKPATVQKT